MAKAKDRIPVHGASAPLTHSLSGLAELRSLLPAGPDSAPTSLSPSSATKPAALAGPIGRSKKLVLRRERKGHGGKLATRIEGLAGNGTEISGLAGQLRRAFGCGAVVDGGDVVVQGDQVDRLLAWLQARGAAKIVVGS